MISNSKYMWIQPEGFVKIDISSDPNFVFKNDLIMQQNNFLMEREIQFL